MLQDLDHLEQIWELTQEWETAWDSWKVGTFGSLQTDKMGIDAQNMLKKLTKVAREVKVRAFYGHVHYMYVCIVSVVYLATQCALGFTKEESSEYVKHLCIMG